MKVLVIPLATIVVVDIITLRELVPKIKHSDLLILSANEKSNFKLLEKISKRIPKMKFWTIFR